MAISWWWYIITVFVVVRILHLGPAEFSCVCDDGVRLAEWRVAANDFYDFFLLLLLTPRPRELVHIVAGGRRIAGAVAL